MAQWFHTPKLTQLVNSQLFNDTAN